MKLAADENVDRAIVDALRQAGHDVWYVAEAAAGITDEQVLETALRNSALLLTSDKDFGELVFRQGRASSGVLLLRLAGVPGLQKMSLVLDTLENHGSELPGTFSVLTASTVRIRRAPASES